jgi:hypothetical protein
MSCQAVVSWLLVSDNLSAGIGVEDDFAVTLLDPLLAVATERLERSAITATVKHVLVFIEDCPFEDNHPCARNAAFVENVPLDVTDNKLIFFHYPQWCSKDSDPLWSDALTEGLVSPGLSCPSGRPANVSSSLANSFSVNGLRRSGTAACRFSKRTVIAGDERKRYFHLQQLVGNLWPVLSIEAEIKQGGIETSLTELLTR